MRRGELEPLSWYDRACQRPDLPKECPMPTSSIYDSTRAALRQQLPNVIDSQLNSLGLAMVGVVQSRSSQLAKIARAMPLDTTARAKEQRLRRLRDNQRLTQTDHYQPIVKQALHGLAHQRVQLLIDRVLISDQHNILVVSVGFRRRSIPLVWKALEHRGSSNLTDQQGLIQAAVALLPPDVRISVHGDSEFRSQELFRWLRTHRYDAMLGVDGRLWVYDAAAGTDAGQPLADWVPGLPPQTETGRKRTHRPSPVTYLADVSVVQELRNGPVNSVAWWERDHDGKVVLHAVMTNLPATPRTKALGKRRMGIEIVFSQVTKADVRTGFGRWDDIANFDLVVRHDHTIDQEFDHLPALGKGRLCQSLLKAFTECLDRGDGCARLVKLLTHMRQLPRLGLQVVALLDQLALPPLEFG